MRDDSKRRCSVLKDTQYIRKKLLRYELNLRKAFVRTSLLTLKRKNICVRVVIMKDAPVSASKKLVALKLNIIQETMPCLERPVRMECNP